MSSKVNTNYIRVGKSSYYYFDDFSEWDTRRAFKITERHANYRSVYRIPVIGWFKYMNGTKVIMPCPPGYHDFRQAHADSIPMCARCNLMAKEIDDES